jgi:alkylhydroperoxidase family enzyme
MTDFTVHTLDSAPPSSKPLLEKSVKSFGSIPNLHGVMAEAPAVLQAYQDLHQLFMQSSLSAAEKTVVWQSINTEHECHYCVPAHTAIANMMKIDASIIEALKHNKTLDDTKLQQLRDTTLALVRQRGRLSEQQLAAFYAAGYAKQHLLEIVLGISQKVMSNYINHIADTPLDDAFKPYA